MPSNRFLTMPMKEKESITRDTMHVEYCSKQTKDSKLQYVVVNCK
ncbi:MAG: hypothetical protein ACI90V_003090 [Bacillariaceae sp.]|jgi:hypothetical protein